MVVASVMELVEEEPMTLELPVVPPEVDDRSGGVVIDPPPPAAVAVPVLCLRRCLILRLHDTVAMIM